MHLKWQMNLARTGGGVWGIKVSNNWGGGGEADARCSIARLIKWKVKEVERDGMRVGKVNNLGALAKCFSLMFGWKVRKLGNIAVIITKSPLSISPSFAPPGSSCLPTHRTEFPDSQIKNGERFSPTDSAYSWNLQPLIAAWHLI